VPDGTFIEVVAFKVTSPEKVADVPKSAPVIVPPAFGKAALAVVVVVVKTASRVAMSTPSKVELVVIGPLIAPPVLGKAASAVVPCDAVA
jgi:hypothetical protein